MTIAERLKQEGLEQGRLEGKLEGRLEGIREKQREVVLRCHQSGIEISVISNISGLTEREVLEIRRDQRKPEV